MRLLLAAWLSATLLSSIAMAQDCPTKLSDEQLDGRLDAALGAYEQLETATFLEGVEGMLLELPCMSEPIAPMQAAKLHRLTGIHLFTQRDEAGAMAALRGAKRLEPGYVFPDTLLPPQHTLRVSYEALTIDDPVSLPLPRPRNGTILLDGSPATQRPTDRSAVFQLIAPDGPVRMTAYLLPTDPTPHYAMRPRKRTALAIAAGSLAVGAGALYGGAWSTRSQFDATTTGTENDLKSLQTTTNALSGTAIGLATAALANAIAAIAVGNR